MRAERSFCLHFFNFFVEIINGLCYYYKAIGKRIKIARIQAELSQEALAEKADLSPTHMSNIENANTKLSLPMLISIANALSVSADTLLCDSVIHSKEIFAQEIQSAVADCDEYEIRILTEILKASKRALRQNKKLNQH